MQFPCPSGNVIPYKKGCKPTFKNNEKLVKRNQLPGELQECTDAESRAAVRTDVPETQRLREAMRAAGVLRI